MSNLIIHYLQYIFFNEQSSFFQHNPLWINSCQRLYAYYTMTHNHYCYKKVVTASSISIVFL